MPFQPDSIIRGGGVWRRQQRVKKQIIDIASNYGQWL